MPNLSNRVFECKSKLLLVSKYKSSNRESLLERAKFARIPCIRWSYLTAITQVYTVYHRVSLCNNGQPKTW